MRHLARKRRLTRGQVESDEERTTCSSDDNEDNNDGQMQAREELNDSRSDGSENEGCDDDKQSSQQTGAACDNASAVDQRSRPSPRTSLGRGAPKVTSRGSNRQLHDAHVLSSSRLDSQ